MATEVVYEVVVDQLEKRSHHHEPTDGRAAARCKKRSKQDRDPKEEGGQVDAPRLLGPERHIASSRVATRRYRLASSS
jgi:hypothetical protein